MDQENIQAAEQEQEKEKATNVRETKTDDGREFAKLIGIALLIFFGAYCAFYTVADWHMKNLSPFNPTRIDRMIQNDFKKMDKMMKSENKKVANVIHMEESEDEYRIMIDLRAFDNNENNIQVKRDGNILTIKARAIIKNRHNQQITEFQQSYLFENNVNLREMTKETDGNYFVIRIPVENHD